MAGNTSDAAVAAAHRALRADPSVQFDLPLAVPPAPPPAWLRALARALDRLLRPIGRALEWLVSWLPNGSRAVWVLYALLAVLAAALVWMIAIRLLEGGWRLPRRRARQVAADEDDAPDPDWRPDAAPARALLAEADALAASGRYAEAVHLVLLRGVEDITRRRPALARPALTSRDLAAADAIPPAPRALFGALARAVERSLFGGRALGEDEWARARTAYADFALPRAWAGPA